MGIKDLYPHLVAAKVTVMLKELAVQEGFQRNHRKQRCLTLVVDANMLDTIEATSHKMVHSVSAAERLFTLFCKFLQTPTALIFVFDGTNRPRFKRGVEVKTRGSSLYRLARTMIGTFGFYSVEASGEADCLLASLSRSGLVDGVISDDSDLLVFGVERLLRKSRNEPPQQELLFDVYTREAIQTKLDLTLAALTFVALLRGTNYHDGVKGCGITIDLQLAQCGFGEALIKGREEHAKVPQSFSVFLMGWRSDVQYELLHNTRGHLRHTYPAVAGNISGTFPNLKVLEHFVDVERTPIPEGCDSLKPQLPNIPNIVGVCRNNLLWTDGEMLRRFEAHFWQGVVFQILYSPLVVYDPRRSTFLEQWLQTKLVKEWPKHARRGKLECVHAAFSLDTLIKASALEIPATTPRSMKTTLYVPLTVLSVAKLPRGLSQEEVDAAAAQGMTVGEKPSNAEEESEENNELELELESDGIECLYVVEKTKAGDMVIEFF
ncbi:Rad2 nuclease [Marasmius crinis-equi]|uniref:Rad2 nuclease n=1 Tax=Marasmius crinis-equi TaxID=585013 RepID=A0ABR3FB49_9AGAR